MVRPFTVTSSEISGGVPASVSLSLRMCVCVLTRNDDILSIGGTCYTVCLHTIKRSLSAHFAKERLYRSKCRVLVWNRSKSAHHGTISEIIAPECTILFKESSTSLVELAICPACQVPQQLHIPSSALRLDLAASMRQRTANNSRARQVPRCTTRVRQLPSAPTAWCT